MTRLQSWTAATLCGSKPAALHLGFTLVETTKHGNALILLTLSDAKPFLANERLCLFRPSALVVRPEKYLADAALHYNNPCLTISKHLCS